MLYFLAFGAGCAAGVFGYLFYLQHVAVTATVAATATAAATPPAKK